MPLFDLWVASSCSMNTHSIRRLQFISLMTSRLTCPLSSFTPGLAIMSDPCLLPCNHVYCENCILTWLKADDKTCPICECSGDLFDQFASCFFLLFTWFGSFLPGHFSNDFLSSPGKKYTLSSTVKSGPRVLRVLRKIILKLHALPDVDLEAPRKRKIEVICLDQEPAKRPVPKPKNFAGTIPLVMLD